MFHITSLRHLKCFHCGLNNSIFDWCSVLHRILSLRLLWMLSTIHWTHPITTAGIADCKEGYIFCQFKDRVWRNIHILVCSRKSSFVYLQYAGNKWITDFRWGPFLYCKFIIEFGLHNTQQKTTNQSKFLCFLAFPDRKFYFHKSKGSIDYRHSWFPIIEVWQSRLARMGPKILKNCRYQISHLCTTWRWQQIIYPSIVISHYPPWTEKDVP